MNIEKIIEKQKILDKLIIEAHKIDQADVNTKVCLALYVEVAELANEVQSFKYWKKNKIIDRSLIIEEFSDGLHFLMSFLLEYEIDSYIIKEKIISKDVNKQFLACFSLISQFTNTLKKDDLLKVFEVYLGIIKLLNFSDQEIIDAYLLKNEKNIERIKNNY